MLKIPYTTQSKPMQLLKPILCGICLIVSLATGLILSGPAVAGDAKIVKVEISTLGNNLYSVSVTLEHADTGWDHYANRWDVLDENGELLGSRVLAHPHVNEQPFTRSLRVEIPASVKVITIVAADSVHGDNKETLQVEVPES